MSYDALLAAQKRIEYLERRLDDVAKNR
jgi:hypothetical protein